MRLLSAAVVVEEISLLLDVSGSRCLGGKLLAALAPASDTLRVLEFTDLDVRDNVRTTESTFVESLCLAASGHCQTPIATGRQPAQHYMPAGVSCIVARTLLMGSIGASLRLKQWHCSDAHLELAGASC